MSNDLLARLIETDPALKGYTPDDLPEAARLRTSEHAAFLARQFSDAEMTTIEAWAAAAGGQDRVAVSFTERECSFLVCLDGSLYYCSNADSEVWRYAEDFVVERIINGSEGPYDALCADLMRHLGYGSEVTARESLQALIHPRPEKHPGTGTPPSVKNSPIHPKSACP